MRLTSAEGYGLRCLMRVAREDGPQPVGISEIAAAEGLSQEYTAKLMRILRVGGLVRSVRGARGGYHLTRPAAEITVWEALNALDGPLIPADYCDSRSGQLDECVHSGGCSMRALLGWMSTTLQTTLSRVSLADLLGSEEAILDRLRHPPARGPAPSTTDTPLEAQP